MKTRLLITTFIVFSFLITQAFASHDPNQPRTHSIISPYDAIPPLKQFELGLKIQCKESFVLVTKYDSTPACVKPETKQKLIERGWTQDIYNKDQNPSLSENSLELYKKKYDAVIEGKVLWSIGHKGYPLRLQYDIEPIKIHKAHPALRNANTISFVGERDTATEIGKIAVFGLDYDKKDNYFRLVNRFILDSSNTGSEPKTENPFLADNQILTVVGDAPCAWMSLHQIPHNELLKRHDRTGANALLLKIDDDDINKVSHLKEMFVALENKTGFGLNEYEKNAWVKRINSSEIEQQKIWSWLKDTFDSQYGKRSDDSFTSYFTYKEKYYQITWALC